MQVSLAVLLIVVTVATGRADWKVASSSTNSVHDGLRHLRVELLDNGSASEAGLEMAVLDPKQYRLRVIDNSEGGSLAETMRREKCLAGVNGGYFNPSFEPIGLRVIEGKIVAPFQRARLLTGVLISSARGIEIVRVSEFSRRGKFQNAIEAGPFLVDLGASVRGLDGTRTARRTFAAVTRDRRTALGYCTQVSLAELGEILSGLQLAADFKIWRAINLDGGSSSAFWFRQKGGGEFSISEQKPVRDFVGVVPR